MAVWAQAAIIVLTVVSAAVVPTHNISPVVGNPYYDGPNALITFEVDFEECIFRSSSGSVKFDVRIQPAGQECGSANSVSINNYTLPVIDWHSPANVSYTIRASSSALDGTFTSLEASTELTCLDGRTSVLSFRLASCQDGRPGSNGFSLAFTQQGKVQILHHESKPSTGESSVDHERSRPGSDKTPYDREFHNLLEGEYTGLLRDNNRLEQARKHLARWEEQHRRQERKIGVMIVDKFTSCHELRCYVDSVTSIAPHLREAVSALFEHHPDLLHPNVWNMDHSDQLPLSDESLHDVGDETHLYWHGSHSGIFGNTIHEHTQRPCRPPSTNLYLLLGLSLGFLLFSNTLFLVVRCIRSKEGRHTKAQRKRDRAARCEERKARAAYKRAACRHKLKSWWSRFRKPKEAADFEDKQVLVNGRESILESIVQNQITDVQCEHETAVATMHAEKRARLPHRGINFENPRRYLSEDDPNDGSRSSSLGSINTLPPYLGSPPTYAAELDGDIIVVEGFSQMSSNGSNTSASSVVDCESEMSFGTGSSAASV